MPRASLVCAWCEKDLGMSEQTNYPEGAVSHGICRECARLVLGQRAPCLGCTSPNLTKCGVLCRDACELLGAYQEAHITSDPSVGVVDYSHEYGWSLK